MAAARVCLLESLPPLRFRSCPGLPARCLSERSGRSLIETRAKCPGRRDCGLRILPVMGLRANMRGLPTKADKSKADKLTGLKILGGRLQGVSRVSLPLVSLSASWGSDAERCESGRFGVPGEHVCWQRHRGFESHPLRHSTRSKLLAHGKPRDASSAAFCESNGAPSAPERAKRGEGGRGAATCLSARSARCWARMEWYITESSSWGLTRGSLKLCSWKLRF